MDEDQIKYWVGCNTEAAVQIYFNSITAIDAQHEYLALFNEKGDKIKEFKLVGSLYTEDF